ncbi:MAG TPA: hypothetical protein VGR35_16185 [Tepidisphaeraceae bacterium]|nr:hypothetical protein [Tepidisphaeraceae bacterium]
MTVTPRTASYDPMLDSHGALTARSAMSTALADEARRDRKIFWATMAVVTTMFLLLQNPYWVPAGDSEVYISVARSMVKGEGYRFNGQPVAMVPPGWPTALAAVMWISPSFLVLKLFTMVCMIGALGITYWICRRWVSPGWASFVVLSMATLSHVGQATFWLISEGLFCLVTSASLLLAIQIRERWTVVGERTGWWRIALLCVLAAVAVLVRWAGVLGILPIAAILMRGESPRDVLNDMGRFVRSAWNWARSDGRSDWVYAWTPTTRLWLTMFVVGLAASTTFIVLRKTLAGWETSESAPLTSVSMADTAGGASGDVNVGGQQLILADRFVAMQYNLISTSGFGGTTYQDRFVGWGRWFSWLFWQPFRAGMGDPLIDLGAIVFGWFIIALLVFAAGYGAARREWMWLALLAYTGALSLNWPNVNPRYYVPVYFLLILALLTAARVLRSFGPGLWRGTISVLWWMFLGSVVLTNVAIWAKEVQVARSDDFYAEYEAGLNQTIISANRYLAQLPDLKDAEVVVTPSYINLGKKRQSQFALRATTMLTDRDTINLPRDRQWPPSTKLAWWCQHYGIKYYLHQHAISPWRVWHFRVPEKWQERVQGAPVDRLEAGWKLYRVVPYVPAVPGVLDEIPPKLIPIETPPSRDWPTRVPGL